MSNADHRVRIEDVDLPVLQHVPPVYPAPSQNVSHDPPGESPPVPDADPILLLPSPAPDASRPEFNLLVAGCRGGKTSFLRLLLDTSLVSPRTSKDQLASVAKFVQGCSAHTSYIRSASIDINLDLDGTHQLRPLGLTLIDTPSFDFNDQVAAERLLNDILRQVDSRFVEAVEDDWKAQSGDRFIHLCIYFLDPDQIVPPSVPGPPAPLIPRQRASSFSQPDHEPVILEPPVSTNQHLARPSLPQADIAAIRRLSARVNVLPVIAKADTLSNDRLAAVKLAIRRDLAEAGIGFGIFDVDPPLAHADENVTSSQPGSSNGYVQTNGTPSNINTSPPTSPTSTPLLRLPYALISPDMYSHSDGVARRSFSRHELVQQYTPSPHPPSPQYPRGKFLRSYRWGVLDVLEPTHSDFITLRLAIFHHMATLQRYTRDYLFQKFHTEYSHLQQPARQAISHLPQMPTIAPSSRPVLAIDTAAQQPTHRHSIPVQQQQQPQRDLYPAETPQRPIQEPTPTTIGNKPSSRLNKQRSKKINVACNFCRSRKLKCDGGRPACGQCTKRTNPCDYMPHNKRRGNIKQKRPGEESESDSAADGSREHDEPSLSPEVRSNPLSRRSSNAGRQPQDVYNTPTSLPSVSSISDRRAEAPIGASAGPSTRPKIDSNVATPRGYFPDNEIPHITTLPLSDTSPPTPAPMSAPTLPPLRPASELQAAQRKRAATMPGKSIRQSTNSGPKVVACNFCRARKTKCDGGHPACSSCARRQLACNYVHDSIPNGSPQKKARRTSTSKFLTGEAHSVSPPSSRMLPTPSSAIDTRNIRDVNIRLDGDLNLKRPQEYPEMHRSPKKLRMDS